MRSVRADRASSSAPLRDRHDGLHLPALPVSALAGSITRLIEEAVHLLPVWRGRDHLDRAALLGRDQEVDAQRLAAEAVVRLAVVSSVADQLVEAHHLGRIARQRVQIGKGEPQTRAVQSDLAALSIPLDATHRLSESGGHHFRAEPAPSEPPEGRMIGYDVLAAPCMSGSKPGSGRSCTACCWTGSATPTPSTGSVASAGA